MKPPPSSPSVEPNRAKNPASAFYAGCFVSFVSVFSKRVLASLRPTPTPAQQKAAGRFVRLGAGVALGVRQQVQTASTARLHVEDANVVPKLISASRAGHPQSKRNSAPFARPGPVRPRSPAAHTARVSARGAPRPRSHAPGQGRPDCDRVRDLGWARLGREGVRWGLTVQDWRGPDV